MSTRTMWQAHLTLIGVLLTSALTSGMIAVFTFEPGVQHTSELANRAGAFAGLMGGASVVAGLAMLFWMDRRIPAAKPKVKLSREARKELRRKLEAVELDRRIIEAEREAGVRREY